MTVYGWDGSNHDWGRGPMDLAAARRDGISLFTHKVAEGHHFYEDPHYEEAMNRARAAGIPVLGSYFVNHPGSVADQVDWWVEEVDRRTPWWRTHPCFLWQLDAEWFPYMAKPPTLAENNTLCDQLVQEHGIEPAKIIGYLPGWLYSPAEIAAFRYAWWESDYGDNPATGYRAAYPGDASPRWASYGGRVPTLLQYGSRTTVGTQPTCDANAARISSERNLAALFGGTTGNEDDPMIVIQRESTGAIAVLDAAGKRHIGPTEWSGYRAVQTADPGAVTFVPLSDAAYDAIRTAPSPAPPAPSAAQIAAAVVAALPPDAGGGITQDQLVAAVITALGRVTGSTTYTEDEVAAAPSRDAEIGFGGLGARAVVEPPTVE